MILNSVSNLNKALPFLSHYPLILCYLDNDAAGSETLAKLQKEFGDKVADKSSLYPDYKDLNDYLVSISPKHTNKLKF